MVLKSSELSVCDDVWQTDTPQMKTYIRRLKELQLLSLFPLSFHAVQPSMCVIADSAQWNIIVKVFAKKNDQQYLTLETFGIWYTAIQQMLAFGMTLSQESELDSTVVKDYPGQ